MAAKAVYMYQVTMGYKDSDEEVAYCYARNAGKAVEGMKEIFKEKKYDSFKAKLFGEADIKVHPDYFEPMSREEVEYINRLQLAQAAKYSQRRDTVPNEHLPDGQMMSKEEVEEMLREGVV